MLLHDAQYFEDEYAQRIGWGHSSVTDTIAYAQALRVGRLVPSTTSRTTQIEVLSGLEDRAQELLREDGWPADAGPRGDGG